MAALVAAVATGTYACRDIVELSVETSALAFKAGEHLELAVRLLDAGIQVGRYPSDSYLDLQGPDATFAADNWCV